MTSIEPSPAAQPARRLRLRRQRGAALLEGLVVAGVCLGLLGLGLAVHGREVARLEREREQRVSSWQQALEGCVEPDRVVALTRAALQGNIAATAERLARGVRVPGARGAHAPGSVPCNEPAAADVATWSNVETDLERQLLPRLP